MVAIGPTTSYPSTDGNPFHGSGTAPLFVDRANGTTLTLDDPDADPVAATGDDDGVLVQLTTRDGQAQTRWYDLRTASHGTVEPETLPDWYGGPSPDVWSEKTIAVSPQAVAFQQADGSVVRYSRLDGSATTHPTSGTVSAVAVTDTGTAWETATGTPRTVTTCREPGGPCATVSEATQGDGADDRPPAPRFVVPEGNGAGRGVVAVGNDFAINAGSARTDRAIRRLSPGSNTPGPILDTVNPAPPISVDIAPGRLLVDLGYERYQQAVTDHGLGGTALLPGTLEDNVRPAYSGSRTVAAVKPAKLTSGKRDVVVFDGTQTVATFPQLHVAGNLSFSGDKVLVPEVGKSEVFSVSDPTAKPVSVPGRASLYADRVLYIGSGYSVHVRDLAGRSPRDVTLSLPTGDANEQTSGAQLFGDWGMWSTTTYHGSNYDVSRSLQVVHLTPTGSIDRRLAIPGGDYLSAPDVPVLRAGFLTYLSPDRAVHVVDLTTDLDSVIGHAANAADNGIALGADDDAVTWIGDDNLIHVVTVHPTQQVGPQLLDLVPTVAAVTSPIGGELPAMRSRVSRTSSRAPQAALVVRADLSRPATAWTLLVKDGAGRVVSRTTGSAKTGTIVARWAGGPPGHYTWQLTGRGRGGQIVVRDGRRAVMKGSLTLR